MKILIIEDDKNIFEALKRELESWNYEVCGIREFSNIIAEFNEYKPHLVLLDIMLPYNNGFYWCSEIRKISKVPIIFLSSKSENMDIVMAMQIGGDEYITKPLDLSICTAKIKAILRRCYDFASNSDFLSFGNIYLFPDKSQIVKDASRVDLTKTESLIMQALFMAKGDVVSREKLIEKCWKGDDFIDDNTLAVNMTRLRKKLASIGIENLIGTKKKHGYFLSKEDTLPACRG